MIKFLRKPSTGLFLLLVSAGLGASFTLNSSMSVATEQVISKMLQDNHTELTAGDIKSVNTQSVPDTPVTEIKGEIKEGKLSLGALDTLFKPKKSGGAWILPFKHFTTKGRFTLLYRNKPILIPFSLTLTTKNGSFIEVDLTANGDILGTQGAIFQVQATINLNPDIIDITLKDATLSTQRLVIGPWQAAPFNLALAPSELQLKPKKDGGFTLTHKLYIKPLTQQVDYFAERGSKPLRSLLTLTKLSIDGTLDTHYKATVTVSGDAAIPDQSLVIAGIESRIHISDFSPLTTPPNQTLRIKKLVAGIPLENGAMTFQLTPGKLSVSPTIWDFAQGKFHTEALQLDLGNLPNERFVIAADKLQLNELVTLLMKKDIVTTGQLSGRIPVRLIKGMPMIENGKLASVGGGIIQYTAKDSGLPAGNKNIDLLLAALHNFNYTSLMMKLNSKAIDLVEADLTILGSSPEVYSGKSIELNIHLQGNFADILKSNINAYQLPKHLQQQLLETMR